jgi:probable phosphoglycerate mutase
VQPAVPSSGDRRAGGSGARAGGGRRAGAAGDRLRRLGGYTFAEVKQKWPRELDAWLADTGVAPPFGESFDATATRVREARDRILASYGGLTVVLVSHVTPIKTLLRFALDAPPAALYRMHLDLASLSEVQWFADGPAVVRSLNDTGHLATG